MKESEVIFRAIKSHLKMKTKLSFFASDKGKGWEKWIQMELGYELYKNHDADVQFEVPYPYDKKKKVTSGKKNNANGFLDLRYRRKNCKKYLYTAVEIKMSGSPVGVRAALADLAKVRAFRSSRWDFRAVYAVVLIKEKDFEKNTKYKKLVDALVKDKSIVKHAISWPGFKVLIIGWEAPPRKSIKPDEFKDWVKSTLNLCRTAGPKLKAPAAH